MGSGCPALPIEVGAPRQSAVSVAPAKVGSPRGRRVDWSPLFLNNGESIVSDAFERRDGVVIDSLLIRALPVTPPGIGIALGTGPAALSHRNSGVNAQADGRSARRRAGGQRRHGLIQ